MSPMSLAPIVTATATATSSFEASVLDVGNATDQAAKNETNADQHETQNDHAGSNGLEDVASSDPLPALETPNSPDDDHNADGGTDIRNERNYQATATRETNAVETSVDTSNNNSPLVCTNTTSTVSTASQEDPAASIVSPDSEGNSSSTGTIHDNETRMEITPTTLQRSRIEPGKEVKRVSSTEAARNICNPSKIKPEESSSASQASSPSTNESSLENDPDGLPNDDNQALQLLHFEDDPAQYDGSALWRCMWNRCRYNSANTVEEGAACMALQRLRTGKTNAKTEHRELHGLFKHHEPSRLRIQEFLGILQLYQGNSLLEPPIGLIKRSTTSSGKPQKSCLTCIEKGRICVGTDTIESRCFACHADGMRQHDKSNAHECYWVNEEFGLLSWENIQDFFGFSTDNTINLKRKAPDDGITDQPKKRSRKTNSKSAPSGQNPSQSARKSSPYVRTAEGLQPRHIQQPNFDGNTDGLLPSRSLKLETFVNSPDSSDGGQEVVIATNQWKSVKAAFVWHTWQTIRVMKYTRKFSESPNYSFSFRREQFGRKIAMTEEDVVRLDREIRTGKMQYFKNVESLVFFCKATPGTKIS